MTRNVLVLLDTPASELRSPALEILTIARTLGTVEAVALEEPSAATLDQLAAHGVARVHRVDLPADLSDDARHLTPVVAEAFAAVARAAGAQVLLLTSSFPNKEVAARAAHTLGAGLVIDAAALRTADDGALVAGKRVFAGAWDTECAVSTDVAVVTVRANAVVPTPADASAVPEVVAHDVAPSASATAARVVSRTTHETDGDGRPELAEAAIVVAGGRGTDGDFTPVLDLADALGAAVGASRDAVFEGWFDTFVGQTGVTVAPRLYVGAGISGAPHHRGGMQASQVIVAVNNDPECPIFEICDFAVVGDLADVLPQAAAAIRAHKGV
ncbi:electron transfer flavoprotein alpha subunit apoprotein [Sediminihabitans luteus]|uniref:Electron transfer flavoprotein alpha subunit apoprotein n=1 Tax=Sediminihabitans luteus TaxID=1138585 RepID=A0A2M9CDZ1_9CELL|nr:electron transfer flavoprotein subunit alpha/FixB family protein [Sediminihabitans luteus]PJJ70099.1 electron transfer flavoprotein alpha subunit apoprotein [Sediminihabitans luteus]GIJ00117.1 electron transfer flavoprotein subunit alpha [Sediminihabitans luteus]